MNLILYLVWPNLRFSACNQDGYLLQKGKHKKFLTVFCIKNIIFWFLTDSILVISLWCHYCITQQLIYRIIIIRDTDRHSCTRSSGEHVAVASDQLPCLYNFHTIRMHVYYMYSVILLACMSVTLEPDQQVCLLQLLWDNTHVYNRPSAIAVTAESDQQPFINSCT